jgi:hypothetical protein
LSAAYVPVVVPKAVDEGIPQVFPENRQAGQAADDDLHEQTAWTGIEVRENGDHAETFIKIPRWMTD